MIKSSKKPQDPIISQVVVLAVIFGFAAGLVGQIVADVYFNPGQQFYPDPDRSTTDPTAIAIIPELRRINRVVGVEQDFAVERVVEQNIPTLVGLYRRKAAVNQPLQQLYRPDELLGSGFILTSDGWVVSHQSVTAAADQDDVVVIYNNRQYLVDELITDTMSGVTFLKISVENLPVVVLGDSDQNFAGQLSIVVDAAAGATVTNIQHPAYRALTGAESYVVSSEAYATVIRLKDALPASYTGAPLLNLAGEVMGITVVNQSTGLVVAVPINHFRPVILDVLRDRLIKRPYLGVSYLDLAHTPGLDAEQRQDLNRGTLVYQAPLRNSPAADAGLTVDDIIISIDNQPLDAASNLTTIIQQYQPGDTLQFEIMRTGTRLTESVTLALFPE